jgi:hypothetical protein
MDQTKGAPRSDDEFAWQKICDLRDSEEHFNGIKAKCRTLASTWLLAAFAAMGFMISEEISISIPVEVVILGLGLAAASGMLLLWVLDLLVYHRLLDAYFIEAVSLEQNYPQLPQVRQQMIASMPRGQTTGYQVWFYIGTISAPLVFSGVLFSYWCFRFGVWAGVLAAVVMVSLILAIGYLVRRKSPNPALLKTQLTACFF